MKLKNHYGEYIAILPCEQIEQGKRIRKRGKRRLTAPRVLWFAYTLLPCSFALIYCCSFVVDVLDYFIQVPHSFMIACLLKLIAHTMLFMVLFLGNYSNQHWGPWGPCTPYHPPCGHGRRTRSKCYYWFYGRCLLIRELSICNVPCSKCRKWIKYLLFLNKK